MNGGAVVADRLVVPEQHRRLVESLLALLNKIERGRLDGEVQWRLSCKGGRIMHDKACHATVLD